MGNTSRPPSPKVNASGGEPTTMSSGVARSTWRGQVSQAASTSRWVCTAALGVPVVPEVKASSAMSVAAVGQGALCTHWRAAMASSECGTSTSPVLNTSSVMPAVAGSAMSAVLSSSCSFKSHSASTGFALAMMAPSSLARSSGMVATAIRPACTVANQASAMATELPPRSKTRLPGTRPSSTVSAFAMRFTSVCACA